MTGIDRHLCKILDTKSSGQRLEKEEAGYNLHLTLVTSFRSISRDANDSSTGCSKDTEMFVMEEAVTSKVKVGSFV